MTVHVVGNITEDLVFSLPRLPRAGETVIASERLADMGGKGLNQAILLARAGCDVNLVAAVGSDDIGERAQSLVSRELPGSSLLPVEAPSDQSIIVVAADGENHIVSSAGAADALDASSAIDTMGDISANDTVVVQGNFTKETTRAVLAAGRVAGAWTIANPSPIRWDWNDIFPLCDLLVVNQLELAELAGTNDATPADLIAAGARAVLQTLGADGARHMDAHGETTAPAASVEVVDSAGAGDTYLAIFVAGRLAGLDLPSALTAAGRAAGVAISRRGTLLAFPTRAEIATCLRAEAIVG